LSRSPTDADVERARAAVADVVRRTPVLPSATLTERCGTPVVLKAESLQRTGSFKLQLLKLLCVNVESLTLFLSL